MDYVEPKIAQDMPGMRLALTMGAPGPWSESAKGIFHLKGIDYVPVGQVGGAPNEDLVAWTGIRNAPVAVYNDEQPVEKWTDILALAERIAPDPRLVPEDPTERALMFNLATEICSERGFAWQRRLMMIHNTAVDGEPNEGFKIMADDYGYNADEGATAPEKAAQTLRLLATQLHDQKARGSKFFIGDGLSALDVYWACFCALVRPLPDEQCAMAGFLRQLYEPDNDVVEKAIDPILVEHRDMMYAEYLGLPMDF